MIHIGVKINVKRPFYPKGAYCIGDRGKADTSSKNRSYSLNDQGDDSLYRLPECKHDKESIGFLEPM